MNADSHEYYSRYCVDDDDDDDDIERQESERQ
jgi:hypothetical protein